MTVQDAELQYNIKTEAFQKKRGKLRKILIPIAIALVLAGLFCIIFSRTTCTSCDGTGVGYEYSWGTSDCYQCSGTGIASDSTMIFCGIELLIFGIITGALGCYLWTTQYNTDINITKQLYRDYSRSTDLDQVDRDYYRDLANDITSQQNAKSISGSVMFASVYLGNKK